jgi:hypothetical protein
MFEETIRRAMQQARQRTFLTPGQVCELQRAVAIIDKVTDHAEQCADEKFAYRLNNVIDRRSTAPCAASAVRPEVTERPTGTHKGTHAERAEAWYLREYNGLSLCGGLRSGVAT